MMRKSVVTCLVGSGVLLGLVLSAAPVGADEIPEKYRETVKKGLEYLAKMQRPEGKWGANGDQYPISMTGLAGIAMLMEGSTIRDGKYAEKIRKATDWFMERSQRNGLLGNPNNPTESARYMYGHGYGMLFLATVYGEEEDGDRRRKLERILTKAVEFAGTAQTNRGGWGYVSASDGNGFDEGSVTITQMQGLRAARNAGIVVPKKVIDRAHDYLKKCTTPAGGVIYSLAHGAAFNGGERPTLTASAIACMFSAGEYNSDLAKKWLKYCQRTIPIDRSGRDSFGHWEYTQYYYAQTLYILGEKGYVRMFPDSKESDRLTWSKYREVTFDYILSRQSTDGSWNMSGIGTVYSTACCLAILQLDNGTLPIYQR
jgi:hypothetical protein